MDPRQLLAPPVLVTVLFVVWCLGEGALHLRGMRQPDAPDHQRAGLDALMAALFGSTLYGVVDSALRWTTYEPPCLISQWGGFALVLVGIGIRVVARATLKENFSGFVQTAPGHRLVTTGLYGWVRHPLYLATLMTLIGLPMALGSLGALAIALGVGLPALAVRLRQEETALATWFGDEYTEYRKRTAALVPFVW